MTEIKEEEILEIETKIQEEIQETDVPEGKESCFYKQKKEILPKYDPKSEPNFQFFLGPSSSTETPKRVRPRNKPKLVSDHNLFLFGKLTISNLGLFSL